MLFVSGYMYEGYCHITVDHHHHYYQNKMTDNILIQNKDDQQNDDNNCLKKGVELSPKIHVNIPQTVDNVQHNTQGINHYHRLQRIINMDFIKASKEKHLDGI
jgi:hypothetical protein